MTSNNVFCKNISHINKHLKIHQLNFIKIITKDFKKKASERYQSLSKKKKKKSDNIVVKDTKIYQKMKNKSLLSIQKNIIK